MKHKSVLSAQQPAMLPLLWLLLILVPCQAQSQETAETRQLRAWSAEFKPEVVEVASGVYTAVGYGGSTMSMIVGDGGLVIIDTGDSTAAATQAREAFRRISQLPVRAIIYTHGHRDHTLGSSVFVDHAGPAPQIWAHKRFGVELGTLQHAGLSIYRERGARQFGRGLPPERRINNGIGPASTPPSGAAQPEKEPVAPNRWVEDRATLQIAGLTLELAANPGETEDQLYIWLPERKVLFAGDNFYRCMPNLYAIRGTPYRDVLQWANAVERLLALQAVSLIGGHTRPVLGREPVKEALSSYRDLIRFLFDKAIEGINLGLTPAELVRYVKLPAHLAQKPFLQPYYGHPDWAVRSIFSGYLGWFDGNPTTLFPLAPQQEAERIAALAGGPDRLLDAIRLALASGEHQWAAQLSDYLLALDPKALAARNLKAQALEALAERTVNAPARNYYLVTAQELRQEPH